ncbi:hypothetical protein HHI36_007501 [Cryptolaemus montrouzieri]|uniref:Uncharacterized protein n=1 Tax=Cryptolaemus montrouzieri TaxID=559131 RepID=A0ABD2MQ61_9CUCU
MEIFQEKIKLDRLNSKLNNFSLSKLKYHKHIQKVKQLKIMDQKESNDLRHGLASSNIPTEVLKDLETEEDLQCTIDQMQIPHTIEPQNEDIKLENVQPNENENLDPPHVGGDDDAHHLHLDKFTENIRKQRTEAFQCLEGQAKRIKNPQIRFTTP